MRTRVRYDPVSTKPHCGENVRPFLAQPWLELWVMAVASGRSCKMKLGPWQSACFTQMSGVGGPLVLLNCGVPSSGRDPASKKNKERLETQR